MTTQHDILPTEARTLRPAHEAAASRATRVLPRLIREMAIQDWLVIGYLTVLTVAVAVQSSSSARTVSLGRVGTMLAFCAGVLIIVRGGLVRDALVAPLIYRLAIHGTVQASYFCLRDLLPVVSPHSLDAELTAIDLDWFHVEPSLWFDRFITPATTEWFAFFYYSYFALLAIHVFPIIYGSRRLNMVAEFSFGVLLCFACGHVLYMVVPGYGPVRHLADQFQHQFPQGFWIGLVLGTVDSAGAQKDIFPSIHTAVPVFLTLFSFRHRHERPFQYTWPVVGFFACNIVIATMFLRWHYLIDVVAGLMLASLAFVASIKLVPAELERRRQSGTSPIWRAIQLPRRDEKD